MPQSFVPLAGPRSDGLSEALRVSPEPPTLLHAYAGRFVRGLLRGFTLFTSPFSRHAKSAYVSQGSWRGLPWDLAEARSEQRGGYRRVGRTDHQDLDAAARQVRGVIERLAREGTAVARSDGTRHDLFPVAASAAVGEALRGW